jgi:hypothetical protein
VSEWTSSEWTSYELFCRWQTNHDDALMYEVLRRATTGDQDAWCWFYHAYSALVHAWTQSYARPLDQEERQSIANEAWAKFARALTSDKLGAFPVYRMILGYLKQCVRTTAIDTLRARWQRFAHEESLEAAGAIEYVDHPLETLVLEEIKAAMFCALPNDEDRQLADLMLLQAMSAREVCARYPDFQVKHIYDRIRAIRERLRRNPRLLLLLERAAQEVAA